jgi:hypothetical protein
MNNLDKEPRELVWEGDISEVIINNYIFKFIYIFEKIQPKPKATVHSSNSLIVASTKW